MLAAKETISSCGTSKPKRSSCRAALPSPTGCRHTGNLTEIVCRIQESRERGRPRYLGAATGRRRLPCGYVCPRTSRGRGSPHPRGRSRPRISAPTSPSGYGRIAGETGRSAAVRGVTTAEARPVRCQLCRREPCCRCSRTARTPCRPPGDRRGADAPSPKSRRSRTGQCRAARSLKLGLGQLQEPRDVLRRTIAPYDAARRDEHARASAPPPQRTRIEPRLGRQPLGATLQLPRPRRRRTPSR
jgi:hypothetical protein